MLAASAPSSASPPVAASVPGRDDLPVSADGFALLLAVLAGFPAALPAGPGLAPAASGEVPRTGPDAPAVRPLALDGAPRGALPDRPSSDGPPTLAIPVGAARPDRPSAFAGGSPAPETIAPAVARTVVGTDAMALPPGPGEPSVREPRGRATGLSAVHPSPGLAPAASGEAPRIGAEAPAAPISSPVGLPRAASLPAAAAGETAPRAELGTIGAAPATIEPAFPTTPGAAAMAMTRARPPIAKAGPGEGRGDAGSAPAGPGPVSLDQASNEAVTARSLEPEGGPAASASTMDQPQNGASVHEPATSAAGGVGPDARPPRPASSEPAVNGEPSAHVDTAIHGETSLAAVEPSPSADPTGGSGFALSPLTVEAATRASPAGPSGGQPVTPPPTVQIATAILQSGGTPVESLRVRLEPAELGSVEITVTAADRRRGRAVVLVERPETLELLQREQGTLERILAASGLQLEGGGVELGLRQEGGQGRAGPEVPAAPTPAKADGPAGSVQGPARVLALRLLDLVV